MHRWYSAFSAFALGAGLTTAAGQTITAAGGNATFTFNPGAVPTNGTGIGGGSSNFDVNGAAPGGDQLFENWWWYRVHVEDSREYRYSAPANPFAASGDTLTGSFHFARFKSELTYTIADADGMGTFTGHLLMRNLITNTSTDPLTINIYSYADLDVNGTTLNNYYYNGSDRRFDVAGTGPSFDNVYFKGWDATRYQAAPYTTTVGNGVRGLVADSDADNLNDTSVGSPGDFTGAFQFFRYLEPGESTMIYVAIAMNTYPIPHPGTLGVLGAAVASPWRRRRKGIPMNRNQTRPTILAVLLSAGAAHGQTITAPGGNATFTYNAGAVPTNGTAIGGGSSNLDINGAATGGDSLFEHWWWYRVDGVDTREYRYHAPSNPFVASGDIMTGAFEFEHFRSDLHYQISDQDGSSPFHARLVVTNTVVNTSPVPRTIQLFAYGDLDVNGRIINSYQYDAANYRFMVDDVSPTTTTAYFKGFGAGRYQADTYTTTPGARVRGLVADADIDNLNNTVLGSPGDFTGAFQWTLTLQPGAITQNMAVFEVNPRPWPAPGTLAVFAIASVASARRSGTARGPRVLDKCRSTPTRTHARDE